MSKKKLKHMNLVELNKKHDYFIEKEMYEKANEVFDYIKENYGTDFVEED